MAMNSTTLANNYFTRLRALFGAEPPIDQVQSDDYFLREFCKALAEETIGHIQAAARCSGTDSDGDTHDNVGIV